MARIPYEILAIHRTASDAFMKSICAYFHVIRQDSRQVNTCKRMEAVSEVIIIIIIIIIISSSSSSSSRDNVIRVVRVFDSAVDRPAMETTVGRYEGHPALIPHTYSVFGHNLLSALTLISAHSQVTATIFRDTSVTDKYAEGHSFTNKSSRSPSQTLVKDR
ncbi:hypothetical protein SK128_010612 [Halocaridina rubra]|uniref:Uncharacterized protein n=1 Tax=Halocaridina rubra TaxID=373956 RepID=A0AAN8X6J0_HALRR